MDIDKHNTDELTQCLTEIAKASIYTWKTYKQYSKCCNMD